MTELIDTLELIEGTELQHLIVLLKNIGRLTAAGMFLMGLAHLYVLYARAKRHTDPINRSGMIFLMFAVLVWLSMALSHLFFVKTTGDLSLWVLFSTFNNSFLIASLPFIGTGFLWIRKTTLFKHRSVWVVSAMILCMAVSMVLFLLSKIAPEASMTAEIIFSMISMSLFGYATLVAFRSTGASAFSLMLICIAWVGYALLQTLLNHMPVEHAASFWVIRTVALVIANSAIIGLFLLTSAELIIAPLERTLDSAKNKLKKLEEQQHSWNTQVEALTAETRTLRALLQEKENDIRSLRSEHGPQVQSALLHSIHFSFDRNSIDKYIIDLVFMRGTEPLNVRCANSKLIVPHAHWIIFSVARKKGITLKHLDIAQSKFQMIKYLNTYTGNQKIAQEQVFRNNGGEFELLIDQENIVVESIEQFVQHTQVLETFKKYAQCFGLSTGPKASPEVIKEELTAIMRGK